MRGQTVNFVEKFIKKHKNKKFKNLLDVGSRNVSGTIKNQIIKYGLEYTGVDMVKGDNVDIVMNAHDMKKIKPRSYDIVTCFDTLEHDDKFWLSIIEMKRVLKRGGFLLLGVPSRYCPLHEHPHDYWRFMKDGVISLFDDFENVHVEVEYRENQEPQTEDEIYGWGQKP